jgi:ABC-type glycerol-3-phosphate transport system permease component
MDEREGNRKGWGIEIKTLFFIFWNCYFYVYIVIRNPNKAYSSTFLGVYLKMLAAEKSPSEINMGSQASHSFLGTLPALGSFST